MAKSFHKASSPGTQRALDPEPICTVILWDQPQSGQPSIRQVHSSQEGLDGPQAQWPPAHSHWLWESHRLVSPGSRHWERGMCTGSLLGTVLCQHLLRKKVWMAWDWVEEVANCGLVEAKAMPDPAWSYRVALWSCPELKQGDWTFLTQFDQLLDVSFPGERYDWVRRLNSAQGSTRIVGTSGIDKATRVSTSVSWVFRGRENQKLPCHLKQVRNTKQLPYDCPTQEELEPSPRKNTSLDSHPWSFFTGSVPLGRTNHDF